MNKHVIEGPGGTKSMLSGDPLADRDFKAALNTQEALHWAFHYPDTYESKLSKAWLKASYGTDNVDKIRKLLAKQPVTRKSWQDNPLLYIVIIGMLTVGGGLATRYFSQYVPAMDTPPAAVQHVAVEKPAAVEQTSEEAAMSEEKSEQKGGLRLPRWLRFNRKPAEPKGEP
jgi:hypothetical protein